MKEQNIILKKVFTFLILLTLVLNVAYCFNDKQGAWPESNIQHEYDEIEFYILNIKSKKIHKKACGTARLISPENREIYTGDINYLIDTGYSKCGNCLK